MQRAYRIVVDTTTGPEPATNNPRNPAAPAWRQCNITRADSAAPSGAPSPADQGDPGLTALPEWAAEDNLNRKSMVCPPVNDPTAVYGAGLFCCPVTDLWRGRRRCRLKGSVACGPMWKS
jgi:hypothetical protein